MEIKEKRKEIEIKEEEEEEKEKEIEEEEKEKLKEKENKKEEKPLYLSETEKIIENNSSLRKLIYIILIYIFYIFGGVLNEKLTKSTYEYKDKDNKNKTFRFKYPFIILCALSSFSLLVSSYMSRKMKRKLFKDLKISPISFYDKSIIGILHTASTFTSQLSLLYIDFIVKTIGKSCKSASFLFLYFLNSISFFNKLFRKILNNNEIENKSPEKIYMKDFFKVVLTIISVILFNINSEKKNKSNDTSPSSSYLGIIILLISLFFDGLLSLKEKMLQMNIKNNVEYNGYEKIICWEYMKIFGLCTFFFTLFQIIFKIIFADYFEILKIVFSCKILLRDLFFYAIFDALGQSVLFIFLSEYGPLTVSMVTSVRKILTISISILYFGKTINFPQSISLLLAGTIIFMEIYDKGNKNNSLKTQGKRK